MKQVKFRSVLLLLLIVLLGLGLALFCLRYTFRGEAWASFSANGHAYTDGVVRTGQVLDRNGTVLYDGPSGVYHEDSALRQADSSCTARLGVFSEGMRLMHWRWRHWWLSCARCSSSSALAARSAG